MTRGSPFSPGLAVLLSTINYGESQLSKTSLKNITEVQPSPRLANSKKTSQSYVSLRALHLHTPRQINVLILKPVLTGDLVSNK